MAKLEMPEWTGSTLTVGAFSEYAGRIVGSFKHHGYEALALNEIGPALEAAQQRLADFVNRERAYDETPEIAKADANRDALWKAFYYVWHYLMQLDPSHALYQEAVKLRSEMTPYKGVYKHELSKETAELRGLRRDLDKPLPHDAIMMLGLDRIVSALFQANEAVASIIEDRDAERGNRIAEKGGDTTASLRERGDFRPFENAQSVSGNTFEAFENAHADSGKTFEQSENANFRDLRKKAA